ncbi:Protein translation factor SUI1 -like protein [Capsicum annuum]|nr:Protein translation factor SUI1 -like protein [Capsicum annuum]
MSDLDVQIPTAFDPFAEANADNSGAGSKDYVHIRIQQRNGRKSLTTVQGLKKEFSYNKILKDLKKEFCCNGTVVQDPELGQVIQLQGDQRKNVSTFLVQGVYRSCVNMHIPLGLHGELARLMSWLFGGTFILHKALEASCHFNHATPIRFSLSTTVVFKPDLKYEENLAHATLGTLKHMLFAILGTSGQTMLVL